MRSVALGVALLVIFACGRIQWIASDAVATSAAPQALVRILPAAGRAMRESLSWANVPSTLHIVLARSALARGDLDEAEREAQGIASRLDRYGILGEIALARGDDAAAGRDFLVADDLDGVSRVARGLLATAGAARALALQTLGLRHLTEDHAAADVVAEAAFRCGVLEESVASGSRSPDRERHRARATADYAIAVDLAPLELRYLLGAAGEYLDRARPDAARALYERGREVDPSAVEPLVGLGAIALEAHDVRAARQYYERARALDARSPAVRRLGAALGG